MEFEKKTMLI